MTPQPSVSIPLVGPSLASASVGVEHAKAVVQSLRHGLRVDVDATTVERMTPSFANAIVMTIIEAVGQDVFDSSVTLVGGGEAARESWAKAIDRYKRGIRLSTQRPHAA